MSSFDVTTTSTADSIPRRRAEYLRQPAVLAAVESIVAHLADVEAEDPELAALDFLSKKKARSPSSGRDETSMSGKLLECLLTSLEERSRSLLVPHECAAATHHPYFLRAQHACSSAADAAAAVVAPQPPPLSEVKQTLNDPHLIKALINAAASIQSAAIETDDEQQLLSDLATSVKDLLKADRCAAFIADDSRKLLLSEISGREVTLRYGEGIAGATALSLQPVYVANAYEDPRFNSDVDRQTGYFTKTILCVPIIGPDGRLVAVVQVINKLDGTPFNEVDTQLFTSFAKFAAVRIRTGQLIREERHNSLRNSKIADAIYNLNNNLESDVLIPAIISNAKAVIGCDRCSLFLVDEEQQIFIAHLQGVDATVEMPLSTGIAGRCAETRQPVVVQNAYSDPRFNREVDQQSGYHTVNILCVPLIVGGKLVAVTQLVNKIKPQTLLDVSMARRASLSDSQQQSQQNMFSRKSSSSPSSSTMMAPQCAEFTPDDVTTLSTFANIAATCLNTSRLLRDVTSSNKLLSQSMALVSAVLADSSGGISLWEIARIVTRNATVVGNCERCNLFLLDSEGFLAAEDQDSPSVVGDEGEPPTVRVPFGSHSLLADAVRRDVPFCSNEWGSEGGQRSQDLFGSKIAVESAVIIPIAAAHGAVTFVNSFSGSFTLDDVRTLSNFAVFVGVVVRHAQVLALSRDQNREFGNLVEIAVEMESSVSSEPRRPSDGTTTADERLNSAKLKVHSTGSGNRRKSSSSTRRSSATVQKSLALTIPPDQLELLPSLEFDIHAYRYGQLNKDLLVPLLVHMFSPAWPFNLAATLGINMTKLHRFFLRCEEHYRQVPYHNFFHAFDVTQTMFSLISQGQLFSSGVLSALDVVTLLLTAVVHDIDHMGLNSTFHTKAETPLGVLTSVTGSKSALEVHHATIAMELLTETCLLDEMDKKYRSDVLRTMIDLILNTDMATHGVLMEQFATVLVPRATAAVSSAAGCCCDASAPPEVHRLAMIMLMKACDISNPVKPFELCRKWGISVMEEFYRQGDVERQIGLDVTPMFDREKKVQLAKSQLGFMQFVAGPFFACVVQCFPQLSVLGENIKANEGRWRAILEQEQRSI
jgi:cAMP-specific phosphodiesterase